MVRKVQGVLAGGVALFALAALIHAGLIPGYQHREALVAESIIAAVLAVGLVISWARPAWTRPAALVAQSFGLLGTLVGAFTIVIGIGPRTVLDVIIHIAMLALLGWGLVLAWRPADRSGQAPSSWPTSWSTQALPSGSLKSVKEL